MEILLTIVIVLLLLGLLQRRFRGRGMTSSVLSDTGEGTPVRLISASCTTGWLDWIHGELLLLPDGILRIRQNLKQTAEKGNAALVEGEAIELSADPERLTAARDDRRNVFVAADRIASYAITKGPMSGKLVLHLRDGGRQKLLSWSTTWTMKRSSRHSVAGARLRTTPLRPDPRGFPQV